MRTNAMPSLSERRVIGLLIVARTANLARHLLFVGVLIAFVAFAAEEPPDGWRVISNQYFSFSIPQELKKTEASGEDSFVEEYAGDGMLVGFDYGIWSNNFDDFPKETVYGDVQVDGEPARIGTFPTTRLQPEFNFFTQIHVKEHGKRLKLTMSARCRTEKEVELAKKVFGSIRFSRQTELQSR